MPGISNSLMIYILIYNFLVSEICLYLMYKPFQYYHKRVEIDEDYNAVCEIDSMQNSTVKDLLTGCIWISLFFVGM